MHQALYRKWRPTSFDEVCGQEHITSVLKYEAQNGKFSHAYLFCGSRGTGKTTCAKILAKAVNCENPINGNPCGECESCRAIDAGIATDVLEMDAASNNGVDNIRDIRDEVVYAPSQLKYRVYIIDEVHMLSASAFNALLKTLEEPPAYVVFILATTELHKLPATIISRCQRFDFRRIATSVLMDRLSYISEQEGIELDREASLLIARQAQGGMRDAISLLELCAGSRKKITPESVNESVGSSGRESVMEVVGAIADKNYDLIFGAVDSIVKSSKDIAVFWQELISVYRDMLVMRTTREAAKYLDLTDTEAEALGALAKRFSVATLTYHCKLLDEGYASMQRANQVKRVSAEMTLIHMCDETLDSGNEALLVRIARLEEAIASGSFIKSGEANENPSKTVQNEKREIKAPDARDAGKDGSSEPKSAEKAKDAGAVKTLKRIREWSDIAQRIISGDSSAAYLNSVRAYETSNRKIILRFDSEFSQNIFEGFGMRDKVRSGLATALKRDIGDKDIVCEVAENGDEGNVIDEITNALE